MTSPSPLDSSNLQPGDAVPPAGPHRRASRKAALVGALVGMTALAGTLVGVGAIASAQDEPAPTSTESPSETTEDDIASTSEPVDADWEAFEACMAEQLGDLWTEPEILFDEDGDFEDGDFEGEFVDELPWDPADEEKFLAAEDACNDLLPDDVKAEIEAWRPYEECIDAAIGDLAEPWADGEEPSDADWEAYDAAWQAADDQCRDLLPEDVQAEMAAWDAFDECLDDAGVFDEEFEGMSAVHIETGDGFQIAEFGDVEGSVTISGTDGNLTVTSTGGVTLLDEAALDAQWAAFDEAHQACEDLLPDDVFGDDFLGEFDVEAHELEGADED